MARGQDAPTQGYQIDPQVAKSLSESKAQSENRLVAAMQEAGAAQRQKSAQTASFLQQQQAQQFEAQQQAANLAAQDRRAAEAEAARRDDQKFAKTMAEADQKFQTGRDNLQRAHESAIRDKDWERAQLLRTQMEESNRFALEKTLAAQERQTNALLSMVKGSMQRESATEKAKTVLFQETENFERDKEVHQKIQERTAQKVALDKRMDLPTKGEFRAIPTRGTWELGMHYESEAIPGTAADPMGIFQDQVTQNGSSVNVGHLAPSQIHNLEQQIVEGKVRPGDIRVARSVLDGMIPIVKKKMEEAEKKDYDFWRGKYETLENMKDTLSGLSSSKRQTKTREMETVGSRVSYALGPIDQTSLGGRVSRLKELVGDDYGNIFNEMTKAIEVPKLWGITADMSDFAKKLRTDENAMLSRLYPELGMSPEGLEEIE